MSYVLLTKTKYKKRCIFLIHRVSLEASVCNKKMYDSEIHQNRKIARKQKIFWLPFTEARILEQASEATGITQTELIRRGINLVASQEKVTL